MYVQVKLINGFTETLLYKVPEEWPEKPQLGSAVSVPLKNSIQLGFVKEIINELPIVKFKIKEILKLEEFPHDNFYRDFLEQLSFLYQVDSIKFLQRIKKFIKEAPEKEFNNNIEVRKKEAILTDAQLEVYNYLKGKIELSEYAPTLLHGVTGSGKTEVYKKLIDFNFSLNKSTLLLLPEVTLSIKFEEIFKQALGNKIKIFSFHSSTPMLEKRALWKALLNSEPILIMGVHLSILLPVKNLGLIIMDEEHEKGYQEKKYPKINSKEAAILRAAHYKIPILLGSATPSFSSLYNIQNKNWKLFQLKDRFAGKFPEIKIIDLLKSKNRKNFWISNELKDAIQDRLTKQEQIIIFINRRGYSFFVQCKICAFIFECSACSISLTLHEHDILVCHYCDKKEYLPTACKKCKSNEFLKKGIGTQQAVSILENLFPAAKIERADLDATIKKEKWKTTLKNFEEEKIDILVGTQTLTKGYHFPNVTLVGVLWADLNLNMPSYSATENCLQQLIQVAGRAGRGEKDSSVIFQIMKETEITKYLNEVDYINFFEIESKSRKIAEYPPFIRFAEIEIKNKDQKILERDSMIIFNQLSENSDGIKLLGPVDAPISKIKNVFSKIIYLKSHNLNSIIKVYNLLDKSIVKSLIHFNPSVN